MMRLAASTDSAIGVSQGSRGTVHCVPTDGGYACMQVAVFAPRHLDRLAFSAIIDTIKV